MWVEKKVLVSGACVGLHASMFVSVTSSTCLKTPGGFPLHAGSRLNRLTWPTRPHVTIPPPAFAHTVPSTCCTMPCPPHHTSPATLLSSLSGVTSPNCLYPDQLSQKLMILGHHRLISLVCTCLGVIIRSLSGSSTKDGASSGNDRIC